MTSWEIFSGRPRSFLGVELDREKLVHLIYLDESGISVTESLTVVAGVIINSDRQWRAVENEIEALIGEYVPAEHRQDFVFHAKDLFGGSGKVFNRNQYPRARSREALLKLLSLPRQMGLSVAFGYSRKPPGPIPSQKIERRFNVSRQHSYAFALCTLAAERHLRTNVDPSEIALLIAEHTTENQRIIKAMHLLLQGRDRTPHGVTLFESLAGFAGDVMPIRRIIDTVHFAEKNGAILLQLADACAITIRYYFENKPHTEEFVAALTGTRPEILGSRDQEAGYGTLTTGKPRILSASTTPVI